MTGDNDHYLARRTGPGNRDIIVHRMGCRHARRLLGLGGTGVDYWTTDNLAVLADPMAYACKTCRPGK